MINKTPTATIQNVRAIRHVQIPLKSGTVVVLGGPNGSGKSTAQAALMEALGGSKGNLAPRDGIPRGSVEIPGVKLNVGARCTSKGKCEVFVLAEDGHVIEKFIDPGIKDPVSADRARIKALCTLTGAEVTSAEVAEFLSSTGLHLEPKKTAVETVDYVRTELQRKAREQEQEAAIISGQLSEIGDVTMPDEVDVDVLQTEFDTANDRYNQAKGAFASVQQARRTLEQINDRSDDIAATQSQLESATAELETLNAQIRKLERRKQMVEENQRQARTLLNEMETTQRLWNAAQQAVADMTAGTDLEKLASEREAAQNALTDAKVAERDRNAAANRIRRKRDLQAARATCESNATQYRELATAAPQLLGKVVSRLPSFSIDEDMRLIVKDHPRSPVRFSELSPGEKAVRAALITSRHMQRTGGMLPVGIIPQPIWESMDEENREIVLSIAAEEGVCFVAADCHTGSTSLEPVVLEAAHTA